MPICVYVGTPVRQRRLERSGESNVCGGKVTHVIDDGAARPSTLCRKHAMTWWRLFGEAIGLDVRPITAADIVAFAAPPSPPF